MVFLKYRRNRRFGDKVLGKALRYNTIGRKIYKNYAPAAATAYTAYRMARKLKNIVNAEQKFLDRNITDSALVYNPSMLILSTMIQGTDASQRTGISIKAASIYVRLSLYRNSSATTTYDRLRVMLITDNDQDENGSYPLVSYLLQNVTQQTVLDSPLNITRAGRFNILYDKVYSLNNIRPNINVSIYKKLNHHVRFSGSTDTASSIRQGHVYLLILSEASANHPGMTCQTRFRYYDN